MLGEQDSQRGGGAFCITVLVAFAERGWSDRLFDLGRPITMATIARIAGQMLREGRDGLADMLLSRLEPTIEAGSGPLTSVQRAKWQDQFETHVHVLSACVRFSSPLLVKDYFRWTASLPEKVSPLQCDVEQFLEQFDALVQVELPTDAAEFVSNYLQIGRLAVGEPAAISESEATGRPRTDLHRRYLDRLLATKRYEALRLLQESIEAGADIEAIYLDVIQPAQHELGRMWQRGEISVAQEHYCTAATQFIMSQLQPCFLTAKATDRTLVATCVGDELHEVGLRIIADLFEVHGWNTIYLGSNTPAESIARTIVSQSAQVLAISTTMTQHLFGLADVVREVRSTPGCEHVKVLVGGYPFNVDPYLWKRIEADGAATTAHGAIELANRFAATPVPADDPAPAERSLDVGPLRDNSDAEEDDLSRLNNSLITLQRQLNKANLQLKALNRSNQEKAEALEQADHRKDEFLAMLAHELRSPLAPIKFAVALLQMEGVDPSVTHEACETLTRQLQQLERLISDLLDASRIAHGKIELITRPLELHQVIHRALEIVHPLIDEKQQELHLDLPETSIALEGDEVRLVQVTANLLTNAAKYTPPGGRIWLSTRQKGDTAIIEVRDTGVGIEAELLLQIFSTFTQEQRSRQHSMGGLGLGLSLVRQLVELHGGEVEAHSDGPRLGSTFTVRLPASEPANADQPAEAPAFTDSVAGVPARRVQIVEDTAGIARMTACLFETLGHTPLISIDGASAIEKFREWRPQIVLLDLTLPDMSGLDVTRKMRELDPDREALIVALTGLSDEKHRRLAADAGCDEYLVKPVSLDDLKQLAIHPRLMAESDAG